MSSTPANGGMPGGLSLETRTCEASRTTIVAICMIDVAQTAMSTQVFEQSRSAFMSGQQGISVMPPMAASDAVARGPKLTVAAATSTANGAPSIAQRATAERKRARALNGTTMLILALQEWQKKAGRHAAWSAGRMQ